MTVVVAVVVIATGDTASSVAIVATEDIVVAVANSCVKELDLTLSMTLKKTNIKPTKYYVMKLLNIYQWLSKADQIG